MHTMIILKLYYYLDNLLLSKDKELGSRRAVSPTIFTRDSRLCRQWVRSSRNIKLERVRYSGTHKCFVQISRLTVIFASTLKMLRA